MTSFSFPFKLGVDFDGNGRDCGGMLPTRVMDDEGFEDQ